MIEGDESLIRKTFLADEFDILTDSAIDFNNLPEEYKVLVGYDDILLLQAFETISYLNRIDKTRNSFNEFVKLNLKSQLAFEHKSKDEQIDILKTYWDYLDKLDHEENRLIAFVLYIFLPRVQGYINRISFLFYSKKNITTRLNGAVDLHNRFRTIIPDKSFFEKSLSGGMQNIIKEDI
jgi:hypothetical protein